MNTYRYDVIQFLKEKGITHLVMAGANGGVCVFESIKTALELNFSVIAFREGIADFNGTYFLNPYQYCSNPSSVLAYLAEPLAQICSNSNFVEINYFSDILKFLSE